MTSKIFGIIVLAFALQSVSFAGEVGSGGPSMTENLKSKLQLQSVINAINGVNSVIMAISQEDNGIFLATVREGNCTHHDLYKVKATRVANSPLVKFVATFVDMEGNPVCN